MTTTPGVRHATGATLECRALVRSIGKLSVKRDTVKAAEAVGKSGAAMNVLGNGQLSWRRPPPSVVPTNSAPAPR